MKSSFLLILVLFMQIFSLHADDASAVNAEVLNRALGIPLIDQNKKWTIKDFQKRTGLKMHGNSGRFSAKTKQPVAGVNSQEIIIYTNKNRISRITVIYANKGDVSKRASNAIRDAKRSIDKRISKVCGQSKRASLKHGSIKVKTDMWDTAYGRFYLEMDKKEFTMLHIVPSGIRQSARKDKDDYSKNVKKNKFGDVWIHNVPMVDQGAKGYCVPATLERVFLYFGCNLDMHHLANIGNSSSDDGTDTDSMLKSIASLRRKSDLSMSQYSDLSVKSIAKQIDNGLPLMWLMYSTKELKDLYNFSKKFRNSAPSAAAWKRKLKRVSIPKRTDGSHICLIIGYNEQTDEIAVSNSWGDAHIPPLWIPVKAAKKVSQGKILVFKP